MADLLSKIDLILRDHPDAMLDLVDVASKDAGLKLYFRLSTGSDRSACLANSVDAAVRDAEARSSNRAGPEDA